MNFSSKNKTIDISIVDVFILIIDDNNPVKEICSTKNKSFLPVINKPILFYQLEFLERKKFKNIHLLVNYDDLEKTKELISQFKSSLNIDILEITNDLPDTFNIIKNNLTKNNFILVEADSILSFNLGDFIDYHIDNNNLLSIILQKKDFESNKMKFSQDDVVDTFGIDYNDNNRVVFYNKKKSADADLVINKRIFKRFSSFNLIMNYIDVGFYIFNNSIFEIIDNFKLTFEKQKKEEKKINLRDYFIPYLIKKTFSKDLNMILIEKYNNQLLRANRVKIGAKLINNEKNIKSEYCYKINDYSSYFGVSEEIHKSYDEIRPIFFQTKNNIKNYFYNFEDTIRDNLENNKKFNDGIPELENISENSYIADGVDKIEPKVIINKTISDKNLKIEEGSKILSCVIGLDSKIGKNCIIKNCIIGNSCLIGDNCNISECVIADNYKINEKTEASQKIFSED